MTIRVHIHAYKINQHYYKINYLTKTSRRSTPRFSLLVSSSRQIRTLIVTVVGVDVFLLNQGSPGWSQQGPSTPPHCIPSHRGSLVCHMVLEDCSSDPDSQYYVSYPDREELVNLVVCCMDSFDNNGLLCILASGTRPYSDQLVEYHTLWRHHQHSYHSVIHY